MSGKTYNISLTPEQLDLLVNVVRSHTEISQQELSNAIYHDDTSTVSTAEATLRALDSVMSALKTSK